MNNVKATWKGDNPTALSISTQIDSETGPEGVNVSYSQNPVAFMPGQSRNITVFIDTSEALKQDQYTFKTELTTTVTVDDGGGGVDREVVQRLGEEVENLTNQVVEKNKTIEGLTKKLNSTADTNGEEGTTPVTQPSVNWTDFEGNVSDRGWVTAVYRNGSWILKNNLKEDNKSNNESNINTVDQKGKGFVQYIGLAIENIANHILNLIS